MCSSKSKTKKHQSINIQPLFFFYVLQKTCLKQPWRSSKTPWFLKHPNRASSLGRWPGVLVLCFSAKKKTKGVERRKTYGEHRWCHNFKQNPWHVFWIRTRKNHFHSSGFFDNERTQLLKNKNRNQQELSNSPVFLGIIIPRLSWLRASEKWGSWSVGFFVTRWKCVIHFSDSVSVYFRVICVYSIK